MKLLLPGRGRYDAVLILDSAIGSDQTQKFVDNVGPDDKIKRRTIEPGPISHGLRIILSAAKPQPRYQAEKLKAEK